MEENAAQRARVKKMSVDDLSEFLAIELDIPGVYCEVLEGICEFKYYVLIFWHVFQYALHTDNYVDGQVLFTLTKSDLVEMIPPIGLVKNILSITEEQSVRIHTL